MSLIADKIFDDLLIERLKITAGKSIKRFTDVFKFGTVVTGPGILMFLSPTNDQVDSFSSTVHADDKLN